LTTYTLYKKEKADNNHELKKKNIENVLWISIFGLFFIILNTLVSYNTIFEFLPVLGCIVCIVYLYSSYYNIAKFYIDLKNLKKISVTFLVLTMIMRFIQMLFHSRIDISFNLMVFIIISVFIFSLTFFTSKEKDKYLGGKNSKTILTVLNIICILCFIFLFTAIFETSFIFDRIEAFLMLTSTSLMIYFYSFILNKNSKPLAKKSPK